MAAAVAGSTSQATPTGYVTAEPYLAAGTNIGPVPGYGVRLLTSACSNSLVMKLMLTTAMYGRIRSSNLTYVAVFWSQGLMY